MARWLTDAFGLTLNQREVDFVIPRLDADLPLCIDPFLLYKSRRAELHAAHSLLLTLFNEAFLAFRTGDEQRAARLINFPEVAEVRFGYTRKGVLGRGMGRVLGQLVLETLRSSPPLVERGIRHVEELQLFSPGIAEDRISDLAANVIKGFLVSYTEAQCRLWGIPSEASVPLEHIWDSDARDWTSGYVTVPVDPETHRGILLVPRWIVRRLPWINYDDFLRTDLAAFLRRRLPGRRVRVPVSKQQAVKLTRTHIGLVDGYISRKEREASRAQPEPPPLLLKAPDDCGGLLTEILVSIFRR